MSALRIFCLLMIGGGLAVAQFNDPVLVEGDTCYHYGRRTYGVCENLYECGEAYDEWQRGINPQICSYRVRVPIICCPPSRATRPPVTRPPATHPPAPRPPVTRPPVLIHPSNSVSSSQGSRLSEQKCDEYAKLTTVQNTVITFSLEDPIQQTVEASKCKYTGGGFIVGGVTAKAGEFPHMALIGWQEDNGPPTWNCGGSLISYHFVLTAAHCTALRRVAPSVVRLGELDYERTDDEAQPADYGIAEIIKHPNFKKSSKYDDIALMRLDRRVVMNDYVRPACLQQTYNVDSQHVTATGWGRTTDRGISSSQLLKVALRQLTNEQCQQTYNTVSNALSRGIINTQMCAGDDSENRDTCQGDSGNYSIFNNFIEYL